MPSCRPRPSFHAGPLRLLLVTSACLAAALPAAAQPVTFHKVADAFTPIPGRPDETFEEAGGDDCFAAADPVEAPAVDGGRVVFWATSEADSSFEGVFSWQAGALSTVVDTDTVPPGSAATFGDLTWAPTVRQAVVGLWGDADAEALYVEQGGVLTEVVRVGDPSPDLSTFTDLGESPAAEPGGLAFFAETAAGNSGIFYWNGSDVVTVADEMTEAPGKPGETFDRIIETGTSLVGGRVAFHAVTHVDTGGGGFQVLPGVYLWDAGTLSVVADDTTLAPGTGGETFDDLGQDLGLAASFDGVSVDFFGRVQIPTTGGTANLDGIYRWRDGTVTALVTSDTPHPDGGTFGSAFGQFAGFGERLAFSYDCQELYLVEDGTLTRLLRDGDEGDDLDGRPVDEVWLGRMGIDDGGIAFNVYFDDDDEPNAVYYAAFPAEPVVTEVPTLGEWSLGLLALLLGATAVTVLRRG